MRSMSRNRGGLSVRYADVVLICWTWSLVSLDGSTNSASFFLQTSLPPGASRARGISLRPPQFAAKLCLRPCQKSCATSTTCVLSPSVSSHADNQLCNRHGRFLCERMMKYGSSEGIIRAVMARSRRCTARSGLFMSTVSSGTRRTGQACLSALTQATLLLLASS